MVLQKRLDSSFNGYHLPAIPKSTRSVRRRRTFRKRQDEKQMRAFDLLATVAGNLLIEKENSASSTSVEKKQSHFVETKLQVGKLQKNESIYEGSHEKTYALYQMLPACGPNYSSKASPNLENEVHSGSASATSSCSARFVVEKFVNDKSRICSKIKLGSSACAEISSCRLNIENKINVEVPKVGKVSMGTEYDICSAQDPVGGTNPAVISLHNAKFSSDEDHIPHGSSPVILNNVKLVSRDDDDNSSGCTHPHTTAKTFSSVGHIGERSIRKLLGSRYWNLAPKHKGETISSNDGDSRAIFHCRKDYCKRRSSQMNIPFKKRNLFHHNSVSNYGGVTKNNNNNNNSYSLNEDVDGDSFCSPANICGVPRISPAIASQQSSETHVKLRIKSFRVPELLVEIPETATVGSLKRTVMEAVTSIFGGGLHVGIILQGKYIRDDDKTLVQSGISCDNQVDGLGFTLEPNSAQNIPSIFPPADSPTNPSSDVMKPLARYSPDASVNYQMIKEIPIMPPDIQLTKIVNSVQSDYDSPPSSNTSTEKGATDFNALVHFPEKCSKALALVPAQGKPKRSELVQRRIRRPFSVTEVEALVQAVEKLGTGRWRDVKLRAFNNANHRTYVDLKDKWKTLVHTAKISPQQRRGEPVPQVLLDRVLAAHAYWSQQQTKQQNKYQPETCFLS